VSEQSLKKYYDEIKNEKIDRVPSIHDITLKFSQLSGLNGKKYFEPQSPNELYLRSKNNFLNGITTSSNNNIYGKQMSLNELDSILIALQVNFKIRLNYELSDIELKNYKKKIKNFILSKYYEYSNIEAEERLGQLSYLTGICDIWTQLEPDLIYQLTSYFVEMDETLNEILLNNIENNIDLWLLTYNNHYNYFGQNKFHNEIRMIYPPNKTDIYYESKKESSKLSPDYKPHARDLIEDKNELSCFRRLMCDTSFWSSVLREYYKFVSDDTNKKYDELVKTTKSAFWDNLKESKNDYHIQNKRGSKFDNQADDTIANLLKKRDHIREKESQKSSTNIITDYVSELKKQNKHGSKTTIFDWFRTNKTIISKIYNCEIITPIEAFNKLKLKDLELVISKQPKTKKHYK